MEISGVEIADRIFQRLKEQEKPEKIFAVIFVGKDPASESFIKQKKKFADKLEIDFRTYNFPNEITSDGLRKEIVRIGKQKKVGGIVVQLPLTEHINQDYVLNAIPREKDVDVLGERALGAMYNERNPIFPPAVGVVQEIIQFHKIDIKDTKISVVGLGRLIGKPISVWLMRKCKELSLFHRGSDLKTLKDADVIISGVGKPGIIKPEILKQDAIIIDFGYSYSEDKKLFGDLDTDNEKKLSHIRFYTPTPGGTGPILVAKLFENFYILCANQ
jgi:methylenetetrahydrofolate dehydrogenase (NADP+)/methenyltetrahydrofolate cyclohydrolase